MKYYFFQCYNCGELFYSQKSIKTKKCLKCGKVFLLENCVKVDVNISVQNIIKLMQYLKERKKEKIKFELRKEILNLGKRFD